MTEQVDFGCSSIFGYTSLLRRPHYFALKGDGAENLLVGMVVEMSGDSNGYVPSHFAPGEHVLITAFAEPFKDGNADHIIAGLSLNHNVRYI
jgi:hypothetical protein